MLKRNWKKILVVAVLIIWALALNIENNSANSEYQVQEKENISFNIDN
jgi:hypothetical protein